MTSARRFLTPLAAALVALQALWSGLAATAYAARVDEARFMCAELALPAEAYAQFAELAALVDGEEAPDPAFDAQDCPSCVLGKTPALAAVVIAAPGDGRDWISPNHRPARGPARAARLSVIPLAGLSARARA